MRYLASIAAAATLAASLFAFQPNADAQAFRPAPPLPPATFVVHGQRYCFAPDGWAGPGWYACGFAHRRGFGFGGPPGWLGWRVPWHRGWGDGPGPRGDGRWPHGHGGRPHGEGWAGGWHPHHHGHGHPHWRHDHHGRGGHHGHGHHGHGGHPHRRH